MPQIPQTFPVKNLHFVNVDRPSLTSRKYTLSFAATDLPEDLIRRITWQHAAALKSSWGLMNARSMLKPLIFGQEADSSDLAPVRQFCWNTGCPFDRLLRGLPAELEVVLRERPDRSGSLSDEFGLSLQSIRIDPKLITLPKFGG